jgi:hypothetical protein
MSLLAEGEGEGICCYPDIMGRSGGGGRTSNGKEDTEEGTKVEDQEVPADGIHRDHSGFTLSEGKPTKREAKDQRDDTKQTTTRSGDATENKTNRALAYELEAADMMDCGVVAVEDMIEAADAPTLTMRIPDDDGEHTSWREERDGRGDEQEMDIGRAEGIHDPSEDGTSLAPQSTSPKRTKNWM